MKNSMKSAQATTWFGVAVGAAAVMTLLGVVPLPAWLSGQMIGVLVLASLLLLVVSPEPRLERAKRPGPESSR